MLQNTIKEAKRIRKADYNPELFTREIEKTGYCVIEDMIAGPILEELKEELKIAIEKECEYHRGKGFQDYAMVLFCPKYGDSFIKLLSNEDFISPVEEVMGKACIVYSYQSTSMPPNDSNYSSRIHTDCKITIPNSYMTRFQILLALDDFTIENGATYVLPGSHHMKEAPPEDYFYKHAERLTMPKGSVWYAHSGTWHAGGENKTSVWRHAVTVVFCRAFMKQRYDIPRMLGDLDRSKYEPKSIQKLGYLAQVPASYEEYYAPPELRKFTQEVE